MGRMVPVRGIIDMDSSQEYDVEVDSVVDFQVPLSDEPMEKGMDEWHVLGCLDEPCVGPSS